MRNNIVNYISQHGYTQCFHPDSRVPSSSPTVAPDPCPVCTNILPKTRPTSLHERASSVCQRTFILVPSALSPAIAVLLMLMLMLMLVLVLAPILHCWTRFDVPPRVYRPVSDLRRGPCIHIAQMPRYNACSASQIFRRAPFLASAAKRPSQVSCRDGIRVSTYHTPNCPVPTEKTCWLLMHRRLPLRPTHPGPRPSGPASPVL